MKEFSGASVIATVFGPIAWIVVTLIESGYLYMAGGLISFLCFLAVLWVLVYAFGEMRTWVRGGDRSNSANSAN